MRKKSQFWSLQTIILLLVIFVVLFFLTNQIISFLVHSGSSQVCLLSVIAKSKTRGSPTEALSLECYTNFVGDIKAKGRNDAQKKDYVMKKIADLSYECWMQFGEGYYDVFAGDITKKPAHCFICSKFNIDRNIESKELIAFLKGNHIAKSTTSYYDFLYYGFLWGLDKEKNKESTEPFIFISEMEFQDTGGDWFDKYIVDPFMAIMSAFDDAGASLERLSDIFLGKTYKMTPLKAIQRHENGYAIVYFQISDYYWNQLWIKQEVDAIARGIGIYDKPVPPARFLITKYENVANLGCDMLQG